MEKNPAPLCKVCQRFYGNPSYQDMCSTCYKDFLKKALGGDTKEAAPIPAEPLAKKEEAKKDEMPAKPVQVDIQIHILID